jgi:hypothetical protein
MKAPTARGRGRGAEEEDGGKAAREDERTHDHLKERREALRVNCSITMQRLLSRVMGSRMQVRVLIGGALFVMGCSSGPPPDPYPSCSNGHYVLDDPTVTPGGFDRGACVAFMKDIPSIQTDGTLAPEFITPLAGALLPATPNAMFTWSAGQLAQNPSDGGGVVKDAGADAAPPSTLTGNAYVVIFRSATPNGDGGLTELLRVMTINLTFTPDDTQWATLQGAGSIEASVYGMYFDNGQITDGPYTPPQARAFSIAQQ